MARGAAWTPPAVQRLNYDEAAVPVRRTLVRWRLLHLDGRAGFLELRLDRVGLLLSDALLDRLRRRVDEVLRLLQAETRDRTDDLDHLDLLTAGCGEDDVEVRLL